MLYSAFSAANDSGRRWGKLVLWFRDYLGGYILYSDCILFASCGVRLHAWDSLFFFSVYLGYFYVFTEAPAGVLPPFVKILWIYPPRLQCSTVNIS